MFVLPESGLTALSDADLEALEAQGTAAFTGLGVTEESDADTVTEGERVVAAVREIRAERQARADRRATAASLVDEMTPAPVVEATVEDAVEAADEAPEASAEETPAEPEAEVAEETPVEEAPVEVVAEAEPKPVAASAEAPTIRAARNAPAVIIPKESPVNVLTAAADVPGFSTGSVLESLDDVARAFEARVRAFPSGKASAPVMNRYGTAQITKTFAADLITNGQDDQDVIDRAGRETNLKGGSLVAAGGWCAPSETLYDLCALETTDGIIDLPEIQVTRGGVRTTPGPDFGTLYSGVGFAQTEADNIAGTDKTVYTVPCPSFTETRLDAVGIALKAGILQNAAYPELTRRVLEGSLIAHQHKVAARLIASIKTLLGAALTPVNQGATSSSLEALAWVGESHRQKYRLSDAQALEVIAPRWLRQSVRQDLARRTGRNAVSVSDAEITEWFGHRGLAVQWVWGMDDLDLSSAIQVKPKTTASVAVYPAGTFVKGSMGVISLDAVYDSTDLKDNDYTAAFVEEGVLVTRRCAGGSLVTIAVSDTGRTGTADLNEPFGTVDA